MPLPFRKDGHDGRAASASKIDTRLVHAAQRGDRAAFAQIWQQMVPSVRAVALSVLPPRHVDDVVQDVAVKSLAMLHTLRDHGGFAAWLCTIARNHARNVRHTLRRAPVALDAEPVQPERRQSIGFDEADQVLAVLRELPDAYRETLSLRFLSGLSGPEIADRLGMTHGSVRVNLCRGVKLLRERLLAQGAPQRAPRAHRAAGG